MVLGLTYVQLNHYIYIMHAYSFNDIVYSSKIRIFENYINQTKTQTWHTLFTLRNACAYVCLEKESIVQGYLVILCPVLNGAFSRTILCGQCAFLAKIA